MSWPRQTSNLEGFHSAVTGMDANSVSLLVAALTIATEDVPAIILQLG